MSPGSSVDRRIKIEYNCDIFRDAMIKILARC